MRYVCKGCSGEVPEEGNAGCIQGQGAKCGCGVVADRLERPRPVPVSATAPGCPLTDLPSDSLVITSGVSSCFCPPRRSHRPLRLLGPSSVLPYRHLHHSILLHASVEEQAAWRWTCPSAGARLRPPGAARALLCPRFAVHPAGGRVLPPRGMCHPALLILMLAAVAFGAGTHGGRGRRMTIVWSCRGVSLCPLGYAPRGRCCPGWCAFLWGRPRRSWILSVFQSSP